MCAVQSPYEDLMVAMQRSTFCLMPPGETASSRRLTDAVLAGCIPVFIGPPWHEMPLAGHLNYSTFAVFVTAPQPRWGKSSTCACAKLGIIDTPLRTHFFLAAPFLHHHLQRTSLAQDERFRGCS
jgi:hypothetical protein